MDNEAMKVEAPNACQQPGGSSHDEQIDTSTAGTPATSILDRIASMAINHKVDRMRQELKEAKFAAGRIAQTGQISVWYAAPNTGKTLLALKLAAEAIATEAIGQHVYHINLDDTYEGLITKADLGNTYGFKEFGPDVFSDPREHFAELVNVLVDQGKANEVVLIVDTMKKFTDIMDKKDSSAFMSLCRKFVNAQGTIILLAHTNKNKGQDDQAIPAGTSDSTDDADCAYTIQLIDQQRVQGGTRRTVEFTNVKARGPSVKSAIYNYMAPDDGDYEAMFNSVQLVDGNDADQVRIKAAIAIEEKRDRKVIQVIQDILAHGEMNQSEVALKAAELGDPDITRRNVIACLKRWSCAVESGGRWSSSIGPNNASLYSLHPLPEKPV